MSVSYGKTIMNSQRGGAVFRILLLWEGSIYKLICAELVVYILLYAALSLTYRLALSAASRQIFERVVKFCYERDRDIPLSFLLAFFVSGVLARWWQMYMSIPWMNRLANFTQAFITGSLEDKETARQIRLNLLRHVNLGWILGLSQISQKLDNYFSGRPARHPWTNRWRTSRSRQQPVSRILANINACSEVRSHFGKLATLSEIEALTETEQHYQGRYGRAYCPEFWLPMQWATRICKKAMLHGFCDIRTMSILIEEIELCRTKVQNLINYTDVLIPLVYTQVVIIAVYSYFLLQLFSQQFLNAKATAEALSRQLNRSVAPVHIVEYSGDHTYGGGSIVDDRIDLYVPIFGIFRFLFLMGWMKVAMCLINPFGHDDEDFQVLEMLEYNLEISARAGFSTYNAYPDYIVSSSLAWTVKQPGHQADGLRAYLHRTQAEIDSPDACSQPAPRRTRVVSTASLQRDSCQSQYFTNEIIV